MNTTIPNEIRNNWGRWGAEDEKGSLNLIDSAKVIAATSLVTSGRVISLAQPTGPTALMAPHRNQGSRFMNRDAGDYALGARSPGGFRFAEDTVLMSTHSGTHVDALSHVWEGDSLYNEHSPAAIRSTTGAQKLGADKISPVLTRGVLLDFVKLHGSVLKPSTPIDADDLVAAYEYAGIEPLPGDAVLLHTGWWSNAGSTDEYFDNEPGLSDGGAQWLAARDIALVGADNYAVEVQPDPSGRSFPVHMRLLHKYGVPLIENLELSSLLETGRAEFLFVLAPLSLEGSTASPVTPLAVL